MKEVELKARLTAEQFAVMPDKALALGFVYQHQQEQMDQYYNAPDRNFAQTDEALRLRCDTSTTRQNQSTITYKGPKLDGVSMTRNELEIMVNQGQTAHKMLLALGYTSVYCVEKVRRVYQKEDTTLCLDEVRGLGFFMELECLLPENHSHVETLQKMEACLEQLVGSGAEQETRSYLELLLEKQD